MNSQTALYWMIGFTAVASACLVIQVLLLAFMARASWVMKKQATNLAARVEPLVAKLEPIADASQQVLEDVRQYAAEITGKVNDLLDLSRKQLVRVDDVMGEAAAAAEAAESPSRRSSARRRASASTSFCSWARTSPIAFSTRSRIMLSTSRP